MNPYPPNDLTEVEEVEIASALSFHFGSTSPECVHELAGQHLILCGVVMRIIRRRAGLL